MANPAAAAFEPRLQRGGQTLPLNGRPQGAAIPGDDKLRAGLLGQSA